MKDILDILKNGDDGAKITLVAIALIIAVCTAFCICQLTSHVTDVAAINKGHTVIKRNGETKAIMSKDAVDKLTAAELVEQIK